MSVRNSVLFTNHMPKSHPLTPPGAAGLGARLRRRAHRGFTLAEVMMATVVFTMGILGVYAMMLKSYELVTLSRHRDNARAVLLSFADQFLRLQTADSGVIRGLFVPHSATGLGLTWTDTTGAVVNGDLITPWPAAYIPVTLGNSIDNTKGSQVLARVSREVTLIDPATGIPVAGTTPSYSAAGYMLQATFTITYPISGRTQSQSIIVARSAR
jgi:prepilin-type N-terminal cleavage/methylation domain-containing protein